MDGYVDVWSGVQLVVPRYIPYISLDQLELLLLISAH